MRKTLYAAVTVAGWAMILGSWAADRVFYKSVQPDGRVVYGDAPVKGAVRSEKIKIQVDTLGSDADAAAAKQALETNRQKVLQDLASRDAKRRKLEVAIADARRRVESAEAAFESGRIVGAGDRQGRQLTPQYWDRQRSLSLALRQARTALDRLVEERDSLR